MRGALRPLGRIAGRVLLAGIPVNFAWEMLQAPFFTGMPAALWSATLLCAQASAGDGFLLLALYGLGVLACGRADWGSAPGVRGILVALLGGAAVAVAIEWLALWAGRWSYAPAMPVVPVLRVGLLPLLQMLLLPLPLFRWAAAPSDREK